MDNYSEVARRNGICFLRSSRIGGTGRLRGVPAAFVEAEQKMSEEDRLYDVARKLGFLRDLGDDHVRALARLGTEVEFPNGTIIFSECEPATHGYLIVDGRVMLEICGSVMGCKQFQTVGEGELLGWSAVLGGREWTATARTVTPTRAVQFRGADLIALCEQDTDFGHRFMRSTALTLAQRLTSTRLQLLDLFQAESPTMGGGG